uniref:G-protein coupled receptors family 1 profile domain-containing protein n=1 Tax=Caenorhabditis japonica TaxID=281687 RepID=A0A8R1E295_CAEJA
MHHWNRVFISCHKAFFIVLGIFGNVNLIIIILSTSKLRTKSSYLQAVQSFAHIFCILNSFIDVYLLLSNTKISQSTCFYVIFPVIFNFCAQSTMMFFILLDLVLSVLFPMTIRKLCDWKYVMVMSAGPCLWGGGIVVWGFQGEKSDRLLILCNTPAALLDPVREALFTITVGVNTLSLILFLSLIIMFWKRKEQKRSHSSKIMAHLKASAAMFIATTYLAFLATTIVILLGYVGDDLDNINGNVVSF